MNSNLKLCGIFCILSFSACMFTVDPSADCHYKRRPFTIKENSFISKIKNNGRNVKVYRINYEYRMLDPNCFESFIFDYGVYINNEARTSFVDSNYLKNTSFEYFKELYSYVLEDSVIYSISDYIIEFKKSANNETEGVFKLIISNSEMAKLNGFEVKKSKKGLYRRKITQTNEIEFEKYIFKPLKD